MCYRGNRSISTLPSGRFRLTPEALFCPHRSRGFPKGPLCQSRRSWTKAELREQLEAALANYSGPVTHCPTGKTPQDDAEQREQRKFDRALRQIARQQAAQRRQKAG
jgi:hypothetical protein